jgi:hypothetical protein
MYSRHHPVVVADMSTQSVLHCQHSVWGTAGTQDRFHATVRTSERLLMWRAVYVLCVAPSREWVSNGRDVSSKEVSLAEAKAIKGLRAVFGEVGKAPVVACLSHFGVLCCCRDVAPGGSL